ncbi:MAG: VCBS repeat-containing protein [Rhodopirellula sp.]|nr:VCBS repeat-containing protein [Rhodopirellula sp.]
MATREKRPGIVAILTGFAALIACALIVLAVSRPWFRDSHAIENWEQANDDRAAEALGPDGDSLVAAFCGDCHAVPRADRFPRDAWDEEVRKGYQYYARSGRNDLAPPSIHLTKAYFRSRAPQRLEFPVSEESSGRFKATFKKEEFSSGNESDVPPAISHLRWARLEQDGDPVLLACDMRSGSITAIDLRKRRSPPELFARLNNPAHVEPCDLDQDGLIDLLVADLGSVYPHDHDRGRVVWLRRLGKNRTFEEAVVAAGLGRVADARAADFDGDGDLDLVVAEFGHYRTGGIILCRNGAEPGQRPQFLPEKLDSRPGTIHVPVLDLDQDGRLDFLALVSQEYESVDAFINQGDSLRRRATLWAASDLAFGSSGIEPIDLDQDGDMDILYSNGDAFDNSCVNPSHGVQWLENLGGLQFQYHRIADLPGAYRALAGDFDMDGDHDLIVTAWLPSQLRTPPVSTSTFASIVCFEQISPGQFVRHTLETGNPYHATVEIADFDGDGDLDFAVASLLVTIRSKNTRGLSSGVTVWWNKGGPRLRKAE